MEDIEEANASGANEKFISIVHKEGNLDLEVSSPKVRDYLVRMLNKLFALEKSRDPSSPSGSGGGGGSSGGGRESSRSGKSGHRSKSSSSRGGGRVQVSQVKLLAEHCYSMRDDEIEEMVSAKIPTHSRWESYQEFKDKINRRDELIRSLQDGLATINTERVRGHHQHRKGERPPSTPKG